MLDDSPLAETVDRLDIPVVPLSGNLHDFLIVQHIDTAVIAFSQVHESGHAEPPARV